MACPQCGIQTPHGERCGLCLKHPPYFSQTISLFRYDFPANKIIHAFKYGHQLAVGSWLADLLAEKLTIAADIIIPLPLHPDRLCERGFNQSCEIASVLGNRLNLPVHRSIVQRVRNTPHQTGQPLKNRQKNVKAAFESHADLRGKTILLIDDVMTTGATLNECARTLIEQGAKRVVTAVAARAQKD